MGWSIGFDSKWSRDIGYGVPAYCDHPGCKEEIDRGLAYVCGSEPYGGEHGCGLYFCHDHHGMAEDDKENVSLCEQCMVDADPFTPKPEHPQWIEWKLTDESWEKWRLENPEAVLAFRAALKPPQDHKVE